MRQSCSPKERFFDPNVKFDLSNFIKLNKFNSKVIDVILDDVEHTISQAPNKYDENLQNKTLDLFSDLLYDTSGFLRLVKFIQYGAFYLIEVYDHVNNRFFYLAYSIYDIIDCYNSNSFEKVPYIKLADSDKDYTPIISCVKKPRRYSNELEAINEYNKYIVTIGSDKLILYVTQSVICVSQLYRDINDTCISEKIAGEVTFKIGEVEINKVFNYNTDEIDNTEYQDMFNDIDENVINTNAPHGILKWRCEDLENPEIDSLNGVLTRIGKIKFEAILVEPPEENTTESEEPNNTSNNNSEENQNQEESE